MAVAAMVAKPHMSARQLDSVFVRFNASARSTMTGLISTRSTRLRGHQPFVLSPASLRGSWGTYRLPLAP